MNKNNKKPLWDHIKKGNTFYPPMMSGKLTGFWSFKDRYHSIIPDLIWHSILIKKIGFLKALSYSTSFICEIHNIAQHSLEGDMGRIFDYYPLSDNIKNKIKSEMKDSPSRIVISNNLLGFSTIYPDCPLNFILDTGKDKEVDELIDLIGNCLSELEDRNSELSTHTHGIYYDILLKTKKLGFIEGGPKPHNVLLLKDYPSTPESEHVAGLLRASILMMKTTYGPTPEYYETWTNYFWQRNLEIGDHFISIPHVLNISDLPNDFIKFHIACFKDYIELTQKLFNKICSAHKFDVAKPNDEVLFGLFNRIYRLSIHISSFIPNWTGDIAEILLRCISESYINLKWFLKKGTDDDFSKFIEYGFGNTKLVSEHYRVFLENQGLNPDKITEDNFYYQELKSKRIPAFTTVNIGHWIGKNLKVLSEEAECAHVYHFLHSPCSSSVHGMHDSISNFYLSEDINPLHGKLKLPVYRTKAPISTFAVMNTIALCDSAFELMAEFVGIKNEYKEYGKQFIEMVFSYEFSNAGENNKCDDNNTEERGG
jgi:hypothetical protein